MYIYACFWSVNPVECPKLIDGIDGIDGKLFFSRCGASFFRCGASKSLCGGFFFLPRPTINNKFVG